MDKHSITLESETTEGTIEIPSGELLLADITSINGLKANVSYEYNGNIFNTDALSTVSVDDSMVGRQAVLSFVNGSAQQPIILGVVHGTSSADASVSSPLYQMLENYQVPPVSEASTNEGEDAEDFSKDAKDDTSKELPITVDGKNVVVNAQEQLQLRCGDASITLTKEGKILIRGKYLLNRASGVNRIVGGSVQVN